MNIATALISSIIREQDIETWGSLRLEYLPKEFHSIFRSVSKHFDSENALPTFDDLKLSIPSREVQEKIAALESTDVDSEPYLLLEYLKNEYAQDMILSEVDTYLDRSVAMSRAEENVEALENIVIKVKDNIDLEVDSVSMQKIELFQTEEDLKNFISLGLNDEFDQGLRFAKQDLVLLGGRRGAGKSFSCTNIAVNQYLQGHSSLYFSIEMTKEQTFRRMVSLATDIPMDRLNSRMISKNEMEILAKFQATRFEDSADVLDSYLSSKDRDFPEFQKNITKLPLRQDVQLDIVYDPALTLAKIKSEIEHRVSTQNLSIVIVDYLNQVKRSNMPNRNGQYDWTEQIEVSKALKQYAQEYELLVFSPYQTDATGEARFAKGILDAADSAFSLETWEQKDNCISFECKKMRNGPMDSFTSEMNWDTLKIGPTPAMNPKDKAQLVSDMEGDE
jgi:replicative DNA helicase|tara:strand:- start:2021 stop:3364 length:1344 start_codon:yes stop_codon:yes gene_type:complete